MAGLTRRNVLQLGATATGVGLLAACSPGAPTPVATGDVPEYLTDLVNAARSEGRLTLYTSMPPTFADKLVSDFDATYGIGVDVLRLSSSKLLPRFSAEAESGFTPCDVFQTSSTDFMQQAADNSWLDSISDIPDFGEFPEEHKSDYWATCTLGPITVAYNTENLSESEAPSSWEDLTDPRFKDRALLVEPRGGSGNWLAWFVVLMDKFGEDLLKGIAANKPKLVSSNVPGSQQLAAGEGDIIFPTSPWAIIDLQAQNAPVANKQAPSPTTALAHFMGVCALGSNPNAARLFQHFTMSREGQSSLAGSGYAASVLDGIEGAMKMPDELVTIDLSDAKVHEAKVAELLGLQ